MLLHAGYAAHFICTQRAGERLAKRDHWRVVFAEADAASGVSAGHPFMARADIGKITELHGRSLVSCRSEQAVQVTAHALCSRSLACYVAGASTSSTTTTSS